MTFVRSCARLLVVVAAAAALLAAPVARAFAEAASGVRHATAMTAPVGAPAAHAHKAPRLRRPKQSVPPVASASAVRLPAPTSSRRPAPRAERDAPGSARAVLPDHPPA